MLERSRGWVCGAGNLVFGVLFAVMVAPVRAQAPVSPAAAPTAFDGTYVGVSAENNSHGQTFEGQIDNQGVIKGQLIGYCAYTLTWRKLR